VVVVALIDFSDIAAVVAVGVIVVAIEGEVVGVLPRVADGWHYG